MKQPERTVVLPNRLYQYLCDSEEESPVMGALLRATSYKDQKPVWKMGMTYEEYDYLTGVAIPELMDMWLTNGTIDGAQLYLQASMFLKQHEINSYN